MIFFEQLGKFFLLLTKVFAKPEKYRIYYKQTLREIESLGINSFGIVVIVSVFVGAVITIQTNYNIENPLLPSYLVGVTVRDSLLLEFSSTMVALILAGKIGSSISSEIGTMRVSEQIDALEIMGVNSASFLILPKIIAAVFFFPILSLLSMFVGIFGGYLICVIADVVPPSDYIYGIQYAFYPHYISYAITKVVFYAFIIVTVSSFHGYYASGGALEVGRSSTKAVVHSSILVLLANLVLTKLILS
ncbi:MAG: ABC transporter permease [Bacteroidales bacterium]|nr:ABC transporter permease [Bacteroidales bacterium]MCF8389214.1 ABC transporter permease [Bacteroidales bacterium]